MQNNRKNEFRSVNFETEVRAEDGSGKKLVVRGYPILFNTPTKVYDWFYGEITETILPTALDGVDLDNVYLLVGHNPDNVLGKNGINMRLETDDTGLFMECEMPNTQYARDWYNLIEAKIVDGMSFWFEFSDMVNPETLTRTITHFDALHEITITPFPAYKETVVTVARQTEEEPKEREENLKKEIEKTIQNWEV